MSIATVATLAMVAVFVVYRLKGGNRMSAATVKDKIAAGATVLDVRTLGEFRSGAYPEALHIPLQDLPRRLAELPKEKAVVVYCASGSRSAVAARVLKQAGFSDVVNAGGLMHMPR